MLDRIEFKWLELHPWRGRTSNYIIFRNISVIFVVLVGVAMLFLFPAWYVQLLPGLVLLWGELVVGFAANRVAYALTKQGVALKGVEREQNPTMRSMFTTGKFAKLYLGYALMFGLGIVLTTLSVFIDAVWLGALVFMLAFPLLLIYDMLNDYFVVRRFQREAVSAKSAG